MPHEIGHCGNIGEAYISSERRSEKPSWYHWYTAVEWIGEPGGATGPNPSSRSTYQGSSRRASDPEWLLIWYAKLYQPLLTCNYDKYVCVET